jgi:hypothetical protein
MFAAQGRVEIRESPKSVSRGRRTRRTRPSAAISLRRDGRIARKAANDAGTKGCLRHLREMNLCAHQRNP